MDRGSGKQQAVSPVWYQWHTTTPFSSPDTTRLQSTGDQWTAVMAVCTQGKSASETCGERTSPLPVKAKLVIFTFKLQHMENLR